MKVVNRRNGEGQVVMTSLVYMLGMLVALRHQNLDPSCVPWRAGKDTQWTAAGHASTENVSNNMLRGLRMRERAVRSGCAWTLGAYSQGEQAAGVS